MTSEHHSRLAVILLCALLASVASLAGAFIAQYGFGLAPCHLCLAQRVPYALVILLASLGLWKPRHRIWLVCIIGTAFLIGGSIGTYHAAVEKHWVAGPSGCTAPQAPANQSMEDFLKRIHEAPIVACDQPAWEYKGITMAGMNAVWSFFLGITTFAALRQTRRKGVAHA